jgi:hypothetical protein
VETQGGGSSGLSSRSLIVIMPNVRREGQKTLFRAALGRLVTLGEPINHVLEVDTDGTDIVFTYFPTSRDL